MFENFEFTPNEQTKAILREAGESFAAAALSSAAITLVSQIIKNGILAPSVTRIEIDNSIPAQIYAINKNDKTKAVYIHSKRTRMNLLPAIVLAAAGMIVHYAVNNFPEEKDTIDV